MNLTKHLIGTAMATLLLFGANTVLAPSAMADPLYPTPLDGWCDPGEGCLYYNSNLQGAVYDVTERYNVKNYDSVVPTARFHSSMNTPNGGNLNAGAGEPVWNNAASVWNRSRYCDLAVFYNSFYNSRVYVQVIPRNSWANLAPILKNNNASQEWVNC